MNVLHMMLVLQRLYLYRPCIQSEEDHLLMNEYLSYALIIALLQESVIKTEVMILDDKLLTISIQNVILILFHSHIQEIEEYQESNL